MVQQRLHTTLWLGAPVSPDRLHPARSTGALQGQQLHSRVLHQLRHCARPDVSLADRAEQTESWLARAGLGVTVHPVDVSPLAALLRVGERVFQINHHCATYTSRIRKEVAQPSQVLAQISSQSECLRKWRKPHR